MCTNCAPLAADLFLFCYERDIMMTLPDNKQATIIDAFNTTSRYLADILHSYLLKREEPPYCFGCDALFTVRHFLLECGNFSHIRNKYFHVDKIKQLFNDVPIDNVFLFLKEINLFNKM